MTVTWLLAMVIGDNKINNANKFRQIAGNFDGHADAAVQCGVQCQ
jgi:hypothetical protein